MKTITRKNVAKNCEQLTISELCNNRVSIIGKGYTTVKIDEEFFNESIDEILDIIGGQKATRGAIRFVLRNQPFHHWSGDRFVYCNRRKKWEYIAGQDGTAEIKKIRKELKNQF